MNYSYIAIPIVTTFIGWLTNVVAVKMLFHPRKPLKVFRLTLLHGVVPKRKDALARSLAEVFERELFSNHELAGHLEKMDLGGAMEGMLETRLKDAVLSFKEQIPMAGMFLTDPMVEKIASKLRGELVKALPAFQEKLSEQVQESLDLKEIVEEKILAFSVRKLEGIIMRVASRELKAVEVLGGVLGLLIGLAQVGLMIYFN